MNVDRDLNDLRVFVEVVDAQGFAAAARTLALPPSTVSRRVARLERALGVRLLQRTTRKSSLTDAGQRYYESASHLISALEDTEREIADAQSKPKGRLRVAAPAEHSVTMRLVNQFMAKYPEVRVELELTSRTVNILEEGFDASIHVGPLVNISVVAHKLVDSRFAIVASKKYLKAEGRPTTVEELKAHRWIIFGRSTSNARVSVTTQSGVERIRVRSRFAVNHLEGVREAALAGHGIALLPRLTCQKDIRAGRLQVLVPKACPPSLPVYVTFPAGRHLPPATRVFVDFFRKHFPKVPGVAD